MKETGWNIRRVKCLNWIQLFQYNLLAMFLFLLFFYYLKSGDSFFVLWSLCCLLVWVTFVLILYRLITEKTTGTKTTKLVQAFNMEYLGIKRWRRRKIFDIVAVGITGIIFTYLLFTTKLEMLETYHFIPFTGVWLGSNVGEIIRIKHL